MRETVVFPPNVPVRVTFQFSRGRKVRTGQILFLLEGRKMVFLDPYTAWKLYQVGIKPGETVEIVKRWNGVTGSGCITRWDVNRISEPLARSNSKVVRMPFPVPALAPTGTDGPRRGAVGNMPPGSGKIPLDVAFREAVRLVNNGLQAAGETWGPEAKQTAVSAVLRAANSLGWLAPWERGAA